jgi:hypothetical protein
VVVALSMIPRKSGERQKNDTRDADSLAVLHRGGLLTAVWVPDAAHEAMRDLIRTCLAAVRAVRTACQQLSAFLLRHERRTSSLACLARTRAYGIKTPLPTMRLRRRSAEQAVYNIRHGTRHQSVSPRLQGEAIDCRDGRRTRSC